VAEQQGLRLRLVAGWTAGGVLAGKLTVFVTQS